MGLIAKSGGGGSFTPAPEGTHIARCVSIIDIGMQAGEYQGKANKRDQCIIGWELPEEMQEASEKIPARPFTASNFYTKSLNEKANLRRDLESWRGRAFTDDELGGFDLGTILDVPCQLTIIHYKKADGNDGSKITGIMPLHKSMKCPPRVSDLVTFDFDTPDMELFAGFSDGMKALIEKALNWNPPALSGVGGRTPADESSGVSEDAGAYDIPDYESIPF